MNTATGSRIFGAVATHLWFKKYEPQSLTITLAVLAAAPLLTVAISKLEGNKFVLSILDWCLIICREYALFYAILLSSVALYRLSPIHPLSKYPGPLLCRLTKLNGAWVAIRGYTHIYHKDLHDYYGPIVRVGPNELSIIEKDLIPFILGSQGMPRGPLWDGRRFRQVDDGKPYDSLIDVRDNNIHAQLRKPWNLAFAAGPVRDYQHLLVIRGKQLRQHLESRCADAQQGVTSVNISKWLSFFSFDFMGDIAFGGCFELMKEGDKYGMWKGMEDGMLLPCVTQHVPWLASSLRALPGIGSRMRAFAAFGVQQALRRIRLETEHKDLFHYLYEVTAESSSSLEAQLPLAVSNTLLTIVAGSDTTASVLSSIMCYIACHPEVSNRLREEIDQAYTTTEIDSAGTSKIEIEDEIEKLAGLAYLNAVINEGLRLLPAVPTNLQRAPLPGHGGKMLGNSGVFIPEGTAVNVPPYVLHRDPRYFSPSPDAFIPERWLSTPATETKFNTTKDAFIPFSYGPANCAGKPLAMLELRFIIALLVQKFDIQIQGCGPADLGALARREKLWESQMKDRFVFSKGPLNVEIQVRSG